MKLNLPFPVINTAERVCMLRESDIARSFLNELTAIYEAYGFCTYADFFQLGLGFGIKASMVKKIISVFATEKSLVTV